MSGWVKLHRAIWEHPFFGAEPMSEREAFMWLVSKAAHAPTRHRTQSGMATVDRGSLFVTLRGLATEWRWKSEKRVRTFLGRLENEGMIGRSADAAKDHNKTQITICNYEKFQDHGRSADAAETQNGRSADALKKNVKKEEERKTPPTPHKRGAVSDADFERFWSAYPRKVAKPAALRAWGQAVKAASPEAIIKAAPSAGDGGRFTPHPATWLNNARWTDAPTPGASPDWWQDAYGIPDLDRGGGDDTSRNFSPDRRPPALAGRHGPHPLPGMLAPAQEKARPMSQLEDAR